MKDSTKLSKLEKKLFSAVLKGNEAVAIQCLEKGCKVDCRDKTETTPLMIAAANGNYQLTQILLDNCADVCARRKSGASPLYFAAQGGYLRLCKQLIDFGAPVDISCYDGATPMLGAVQSSQNRVVAELLRRGANVNARIQDGATALFIAAQNNNYSLISTLLNGNADCHICREVDGVTPLLIAAQRGHHSVIRELLNSKNIDVDFTPPQCNGVTPLFKAAHKGHKETLEVLLTAKPNLGLLSNGLSALHAAAIFGRQQIVELLLSAGADASLKSSSGLTAERLAFDGEFVETGEYLQKFSNFGKISSRTSSRRSSPGSTRFYRSSVFDNSNTASPLISRESSMERLSDSRRNSMSRETSPIRKVRNSRINRQRFMIQRDSTIPEGQEDYTPKSSSNIYESSEPRRVSILDKDRPYSVKSRDSYGDSRRSSRRSSKL